MTSFVVLFIFLETREVQDLSVVNLGLQTRCHECYKQTSEAWGTLSCVNSWTWVVSQSGATGGRGGRAYCSISTLVVVMRTD